MAGIDPKVSLGNILTLGGVVLAGGIAWGVINANVAAVGADVLALKTDQAARAAALAQQFAAHEARIRATEIAQASQSSDLRAIQGALARIEAQLERLQPRP